MHVLPRTIRIGFFISVGSRCGIGSPLQLLYIALHTFVAVQALIRKRWRARRKLIGHLYNTLDLIDNTCYLRLIYRAQAANLLVKTFLKKDYRAFQKATEGASSVLLELAGVVALCAYRDGALVWARSCRRKIMARSAHYRGRKPSVRMSLPPTRPPRLCAAVADCSFMRGVLEQSARKVCLATRYRLVPSLFLRQKVKKSGVPSLCSFDVSEMASLWQNRQHGIRRLLGKPFGHRNGEAHILLSVQNEQRRAKRL
jgi:hypothetical protein